MAKPKRYSVYERGTDRPIAIWASSQECADALHITRASFFKQVMRCKQGKPVQKYEIVIHDTTDEEDVLL